jgi:hypothetical protein
MPVHKRITDGKWVTCNATTRACPRKFHAPVELGDVPESMLDQVYFSRRAPDHIDSDGNKYWYDEKGKNHSEYDLPAVIYINGAEEWYKHGRQHRDFDSPSVVDNGLYEWYKDDKLHREGDKPALITTQGRQEWRIDGRLHRDGNQPAIVDPNGTDSWWINGRQVG